MEPMKCACELKGCDENNTRGVSIVKTLTIFIVSLGLWFVIYQQLLPLARFITYYFLSLKQDDHSGSAVEFFLYESPKVLMLLILIVFGVGIVRSFFTPKRPGVSWAGRHAAIGLVALQTNLWMIFGAGKLPNVTH